MNRLSFRGALLCYSLLYLLLMSPFWLGGDVLAPHRQYTELDIADPTGARQVENRKFSDFTNGYIPEISEHLHGDRSGWLALWTNQNELGRPLYQTSGFTPAYPPTGSLPASPTAP